ncbi:iron-containing alcohol dehydrogenase [Thermovirga lienii DSM 17291]|jgi:alcohol dehydrogenase|uniref:Iron-containing alcohol dehydrogenase n=1 Tax=Thermovirga lienii (strain ATCC BAA-1197 / DSM 17291 / Cas60314) TaxID=580340 RepID=G7V5B0_THELD|nr:iron-containing alcohol dehydrogenase [Thermovirga lienii]AER66893.1 iron-containing alcohol dehydrogenase [Thermovirga lienii DSM 17291]MDN5318086.1 alcohol dehydrogenase [Thermovirga sp.]MDN5367297.1 alcohol dehydrogenase [Thermovirga sp.]HCD71967.1 alcohol dehydrogenase [Thermovirga lienii]
MGKVQDFSFVLPTRIEFGVGKIKMLPEIVREKGAQRPFIVTDPGIVKAGILSIVESLLSEVVSEYKVFEGVEANPKDSNVEEGAKLAKDYGTDLIIALGGGSSIDCAKAISILVTLGGRPRDYEGQNHFSVPLVPVIAIPTTAGTGSEVTFSSVITDSQEKFKFSIRAEDIAPRVAIADPELTVSLPPLLTAATGMDALTHAIEGYTSTEAEPIAEACGLYAVGLISKNIRKAVEDGSDLEARSNMLVGSILAGISFSHSDVASVHCIAEALGGKYDAPHGLCNSVVLPEIMEYNLPFCLEKYSEIARAMGLSFSSVEEGARMAVLEVKKLAEDVGLPPFSSLGVREEDLEELANNSFRNGSNPSNPRPMDVEDYLTVLKKLMEQ